MTDERDHRGSDPEPIEVQVARALNWTDVQWTTAQGAWGRHPSGKGGADGKGYQQIPRYGFDSPDGWSCTGPLLADYRLDLASREFGEPIATCGVLAWLARAWIPNHNPEEVVHVHAHSAPEAIARLVVKLAEMGRLEKP